MADQETKGEDRRLSWRETFLALRNPRIAAMLFLSLIHI